MLHLSRAPIVLLSTIIALLVPTALVAYGGPGSVITGIGALLAALAALAAAVFGFLWFPVKRLVQKLRGPDEDPKDAADAA